VQVDQLALVACHHVALDVIHIHHSCRQGHTAANRITSYIQDLSLEPCRQHTQLPFLEPLKSSRPIQKYIIHTSAYPASTSGVDGGDTAANKIHRNFKPAPKHMLNTTR
jgi:hypothetical protein